MKYLLLLAGLLGGCSALSQADVDLAKALMAQSGSNCVYIEGHYGAGALVAPAPVVPALGMAGGALSAAHSEGDKSLTCGPLGAEVK